MTHLSPTAPATVINDVGEDEICIGEAEEEEEDENRLDVMDCIDSLIKLATKARLEGMTLSRHAIFSHRAYKFSTHLYDNRNLRASFTSAQLKI